MLILGPVVGLVTNFQARILLEASEESEWICVCRPGNLEITFSLESDNPKVLQFENLQPGTQYVVTFQSGSQKATASFQTRRQSLIYRGLGFNLEEDGLVSPNFDVSLISCNKITFEPKVDMWEKANQQATGFRLHCGDQIYGDPAFEEGRQILSKIPEAEWTEHAKEIEELYRKIYRQTWGHPSTRQFLASGSNLMVADDHEFNDDFDQRVPDSLSKFLGDCAYRVYDQYQRSLRLSVEERQGSRDFFILVLGSIGLLVIDAFASRFHDGVDAYLGRQQLDWISREIGTLKVDRWLVLSSQPVFQHAGWLGKIGKVIKPVDDLQLRFNSPEYAAELTDFLRVFPEPPLFLSGDTHIGVLLRITSADGRKTHQIISSGIRNRLGKPAYVAFRGMVKASCKDRPSGWSYEHAWSTPECNFVNIQVHNGTDGSHVQVTWFFETGVWSKIL